MEITKNISPANYWQSEQLAAKNEAFLDLLVFIQYNEISIAIYDDILRAVLAISVYKNETHEKASKFFEQVINSEPFCKKNYKSIKAGIYSDKFTLIPSEVFDNKSLHDYFNWTADVEEKETIQYDYVKNIDSFNVFTVRKKLFHAVNDSFKKPIIFHFQTIMIENLLRENKGTRDKKLYAFSTSQQLHLYFIDNGRLLFANQFAVKSAEDYVYFILAVCEQLQQNISLVNVVLMGNIVKGDAYETLLSEYIDNVAFADFPKGIYFSNQLNNMIQAHEYFCLFSLAVCE